MSYLIVDFEHVFTCYRGVVRALPNFYDRTFGGNSKQLSAVHYFCKIYIFSFIDAQQSPDYDFVLEYLVATYTYFQ